MALLYITRSSHSRSELLRLLYQSNPKAKVLPETIIQYLTATKSRAQQHNFNMKLTNALFTSLAIGLGVSAQSNSTTPENQSIDALNLTESEALARSLTWYHLDEDEEQELCGNSDAQSSGKEDILKQDCQQLIDYMKIRPGYWKVNGYNRNSPPADLVTRGTCEFTVTRNDALNTHFE